MTPSDERRLGRREFLAFGAGVFAVAAVPLEIYRRATRPQLIKRTIPVMGTIAEVGVVHHDPIAAHAAIDAAFAELQWVERTMTRFANTSDIGRANLSAARSAVTIDAATASVVSEALRWASASNGAYDPAVGRTVALWDVQNRHAPPPQSETAKFARRSLYHRVEVGSTHGAPALIYHEPDVALDLGAIAKGYAVDRATSALRDRGIANGLVIAGGDLYALGNAPDGEAWTVGIRDPHDVNATVGELRVSDEAVATSGTYFRFFKYRGVKYHHLMDPDIAAPRRTQIESVTVRASSCMLADVATTTLFGMDAAPASRLLARMAPGARVEAVLL